MATVKLLEKTQSFLDETFPDEQDTDAKVRRLIEAEYLRELGRYHHTLLTFSRKYGVSFEEFIARRVTQQMNYSWEVEQDAMAWETAVGGIMTLERKLQELRSIDNESNA